MQLNLEHAKAILGHDDLVIPSGHEQKALEWFLSWVKVVYMRLAKT